MDPYTPQNNPQAPQPTEQPQAQPEPVFTPPLTTMPLSSPSPEPPRKSNVLKIVLIIIGSTVAGLLLLGIVFAFVVGSLLGGAGDDTYNKTATTPTVIDTAKPVTVADGLVSAQCFSLKLPTSYEIKSGSTGCSTSLNISRGDSLTAILVMTQTGDRGTIEQLSNKLLLMAQEAKLKEPTVKVVTLDNANRIAHLTFKDSNDLEKSLYLISDPDRRFQDKDGTVVTSYIVGGYSYNDALRANLNTVVQSFSIKK